MSAAVQQAMEQQEHSFLEQLATAHDAQRLLAVSQATEAQAVQLRARMEMLELHGSPIARGRRGSPTH